MKVKTKEDLRVLIRSVLREINYRSRYNRSGSPRVWRRNSTWSSTSFHPEGDEYTEYCPDCNGDGRLDDNSRCLRCSGSGKINYDTREYD